MKKDLLALKEEHDCHLRVTPPPYLKEGIFLLAYSYKWGDARLRYACLSEVAEKLVPVFKQMLHERGLLLCGVWDHADDEPFLQDTATPTDRPAGRRWQSLVINGAPRWIRAYDNGGVSAALSCRKCHRFFDEGFFDPDVKVCTCGAAGLHPCKRGSGDRYTVLFTGRAGACKSPGTATEYSYRSMCGNPRHPQGIGMWGSTKNQPADVVPGAWGGAPMYRHNHLGKRIKFADLPGEPRDVVWDDYLEIWNL